MKSTYGGTADGQTDWKDDGFGEPIPVQNCFHLSLHFDPITKITVSNKLVDNRESVRITLLMLTQGEQLVVANIQRMLAMFA